MDEYIVKETAYQLATRQDVIGELIRCKNCKYNTNTCGNYVNCDIITQMFGRTEDNFCSLAERETDE